MHSNEFFNFNKSLHIDIYGLELQLFLNYLLALWHLCLHLFV